MQWSDKKSLISQLQKLWNSGRLLQAHLVGQKLFPRRLVFKSPASKALSDQFDEVKHWILEIRKLTDFRIIYKTVRHPILGENSIPREAWVDSLQTAMTLLNKEKELEKFEKLIRITKERIPTLLTWIERYPLKALALAAEFSKIIDFIAWCQRHPHSNIYLRQVSIPGIDSKWIEAHRHTLTPLLDLALPPAHINQHVTTSKQFAERYGFRCKPTYIRLRVLDSALALLSGVDLELVLTTNDFQALQQKESYVTKIHKIFIVENEINFLSFPHHKNSLVLFGAGYGFESLAKIAWLQQKVLYYWGDIDTHGFAILNQLRHRFPQTQSFLMNVETLLSHQEFWSVEQSPTNRRLDKLNITEQSVYQSLITHRYAKNLRLEQERIPYNTVLCAVREID